MDVAFTDLYHEILSLQAGTNTQMYSQCPSHRRAYEQVVVGLVVHHTPEHLDRLQSDRVLPRAGIDIHFLEHGAGSTLANRTCR